MEMPENPSLRRAPALSRTAFAALLAIAAVSAGCGGGDGPVCTAEARASVLLTAVDGGGAPLAGYDVDFSVDGGAVQRVRCETAAPCAIAYEVAGRFVLNATKPGHLPASASVVVGADECHVQTVPVQLTLGAAGG